MAEGTNVGSIFLDLIVRDTVEKQVQNMAAKSQATAQRAFSGMEKAAEKMVNNATAQAGKVAQKTASTVTQATQSISASAEKCGKTIEASISGGFNKSVALAQARVNELERAFDSVTAKLDMQWNTGTFDPNKTATSSLLAQQEKLFARIESARERLAIHVRAAAEKQAAAEIAAAQKATTAIEAEAVKRQAAVAQAHTAADPPGASGWQKLISLASNFGDIAVKAFANANGSAVSFGDIASQAFAEAGGAAGLFGGEIGMAITIAKTAVNVISSLIQKAIAKVKEGFNKAKQTISKVSAAVKKLTGNLDGAGTSTQRFGRRLKSIISSALIFNVLSAGLRNVTSYIGEAITSTDEMKQALANLKGAAANAASPIIQVLTPALTALTNAAATVLSYVSRLVTMITGKVSNAAATAAKSSEKAASAAKKAARSLAGFDEIERLGSNSDDSGSSDSDDDTIEPNYDFQGKSPFLDSVLAAIEAGQWGQVGALFAQKLNSVLASVQWEDIQNKVRTWTQNLVDTLNGFIHEVDWGLIGSSLGNGLNTILTAIDTFFQGIDWVGLGSGIATALNDMFNTIDWAMLGRVLTDKFRALFELLHGFVTTFDFAGLGSKIGEMLRSAFGNIDWPQLVEDLYTGFIGLLDMLIAFVQQIEWDKVRQTISDCFERINWVEIGKKIGELLCSIDWGEVISSVWEIITELWKAKFETIGSALGESIKRLGESAAEYFKEAGINAILGFLNGILNPLPTITVWLAKNLTKPLIEAVRSLLGIHSPSKVFGEIGRNLILGLLEGISEIWTDIVDFFEDVFADLQDTFSETWEKISSTVTDVFEGIRNTVTTIWNNISSTIKDVINGIIGSINGMVSGITSGINAVIRALNKLSFTIPDWLKYVPGASNIAGKKFGFSIQELIAPQIPYLADGGVIQQPTLAMMGEYAGARSNPEIVAPQSVMAETVAAVMEDVIASNVAGFEAVVAVLRDILEAILGIELGDNIIGQAVDRYNKKMAVVKGKGGA